MGDRTRTCFYSNRCFNRLTAASLAFLKQTFWLSAWLELLEISKRIFQRVRTFSVLSRILVRAAHENLGEQHTLKPKFSASVKKCVVNTGNEHGHPLPMYVSTTNGNALHGEESMLVLPPVFSKRGLFISYNTQVTDDRLKVGSTTFVRLMKELALFVRVSRVERGISDISMGYRHRLPMVDATRGKPL